MKKKVAIFAFAHLAVDFGCFYVLYSDVALRYGLRFAAVLFILYNAVAFATQPLMGKICDKMPGKALAGAGVLAVLTAVVLPSFLLSLLRLLLVAAGNSLFHVSAGREVLCISNGKTAPSAIFVSTGALGVSLGTLCGQWASAYIVFRIFNVYLLFPVVLLSVAGVLVFAMGKFGECGFEKAPKTGNKTFIFLVLAAVFVRAAVAAVYRVSWPAGTLFAVLPSAISLLGKATGGILADRFGKLKLCEASLVLSLPLLAFFADIPAVAAVGLFLFNMPMGATLCLVAEKMRGREGFAFGLTTLALFCGSLPSAFADGVNGPVAAAALTVAAIFALVAAEKVSNKECLR